MMFSSKGIEFEYVFSSFWTLKIIRSTVVYGARGVKPMTQKVCYTKNVD